MLLDYEVLRLIWWALLGVLLIGFAITDGFDMGVAGMLPFIAKTDKQRRQVINTVGPVWEGNQVWFILGGGAIFAAWPHLYAVSFSGFYMAMMLVLVALIVRPVAFKFRSKRPEEAWRNRWDKVLSFSGIVPPLVFGVAVGNVLQGVPFHFDDDLRIIYEGGFFQLFSPFALLCGALSLAMLVLHGATYLQIKSTGEVAEEARRWGTIAALMVMTLFIVGGIWINFLDGYSLVSEMDPNGPSHPMKKHVLITNGHWIVNFLDNPNLWLVPAAGLGGALVALLGLYMRWNALSFLGSKVSVIGIITTVGVTMFPFILPSSTEPNHSLMVWDASSSHGTLWIMLIATAILLPIVLMYTAWVYKVLWGKISEDDITDDMY